MGPCEVWFWDAAEPDVDGITIGYMICKPFVRSTVLSILPLLAHQLALLVGRRRVMFSDTYIIKTAFVFDLTSVDGGGKD